MIVLMVVTVVEVVQAIGYDLFVFEVLRVELPSDVERELNIFF